MTEAINIGSFFSFFQSAITNGTTSISIRRNQSRMNSPKFLQNFQAKPLSSEAEVLTM